ncbi:MAG TPA: hypothetical protein VN721_01030 [Flavipsychrobacter sp.]|nr:hypothetical protein [Flavipsychrobacter sp.]
MLLKRLSIVALLLFIVIPNVKAQDTLRVMAYNVLTYGDGCQGPPDTLNKYLKTIVAYTNPDVISMEKMASIQVSPSDIRGILPYGYADSIVQNALNVAYPNRYDHCPLTNTVESTDMCVLFYDKHKLTFESVATLVAYITDFDMYKFYYNDPKLSTIHDTTFLYFVLNHTQSGDNATMRDTQIANESKVIESRFYHLPNMISMGDFNTRSSYEGCYQALTNPADTNFRFYDPAFYPDATYTYPATWDSDPAAFTTHLTTSTRQSGSIPNSCGTSGGAKSWYDHMFISPWIIENANYVKYIPNSYRTIGNDGHRLGISVNDSSSVKNFSAPSNVINALFQFSNKYPVMVDLAVTSNTTGVSPTDPELPTAVARLELSKEHITIVNPILSRLTMHIPEALIGKPVTTECYDSYGRLLMQKNIVLNSSVMQLQNNWQPGVYYIRIYNKDGILCHTSIVKE